MKNRLILLGVLVGVLGYMYYSYVVSSPQYSVFQMYQAVRAHDYEGFDKYADIDQIADNMADEIVPEAQVDTSINLNLNVFEIVKLNLAPRINTGLTRAVVIDNAKRELKNNIEEKGEIEKATYREDNLFKALNEIKITTQGSVALVAVPIDGKPLNLKMRKVENYWEVFEVDIKSPALQDN